MCILYACMCDKCLYMMCVWYVYYTLYTLILTYLTIYSTHTILYYILYTYKQGSGFAAVGRDGQGHYTGVLRGMQQYE